MGAPLRLPLEKSYIVTRSGTDDSHAVLLTPTRQELVRRKVLLPPFINSRFRHGAFMLAELLPRLQLLEFRDEFAKFAHFLASTFLARFAIAGAYLAARLMMLRLADALLAWPRNLMALRAERVSKMGKRPEPFMPCFLRAAALTPPLFVRFRLVPRRLAMCVTTELVV